MKLIELNPIWVRSGGDGVFSVDNKGEYTIPVPVNEHAAIEFDCPCGCKNRRIIPIENGHGTRWTIEGDHNFEILTLSPSIQVTSGCHTHFHIKNGEITP